jgi:hypothetical protein
MRNSRSNLGFMRILACRLDIICLRHCGTRLVVVLWVHVAPPSVKRLGFLTPRHSDARPGCGNRLRSYALLRTRTMFVPRLVLFCSRAAPCESRPYFVVVFTNFDRAGYAADRNLESVCAVTRYLENGLSAHYQSCAHPFSLELHLNLESQVIPLPVQRSRTTPTFNMRTDWENAPWNK